MEDRFNKYCSNCKYLTPGFAPNFYCFAWLQVNPNCKKTIREKLSNPFWKCPIGRF